MISYIHSDLIWPLAINKMTIHNISDDVLFLNNPNQTQTQQQRQSQTSTPDVALQSQMISHRMQATSATSGLHTPGGTTASTPSNQSHLRSSYHQHQPPRSQVSSVRLSNISSGGSSDLDSREYFIFKLVHIFWEGHKILRNLQQLFVLCTASQIVDGDFSKFCSLLRIYKL